MPRSGSEAASAWLRPKPRRSVLTVISADTLRSAGFTASAGVPCSRIAGLWSRLESDSSWPHISAAQEGDACGVAAGVWLAGGVAVVITQNSGVGNVVNPIATLLQPMRIPLLLLVSMRGVPETGDEPQHALMGRITRDLLKLIGIDCQDYRTYDSGDVGPLSRAYALGKEQRRASALIIESHERTGTPSTPQDRRNEPDGFPTNQTAIRPTLSRRDVVECAVASRAEGAAIVATTGKTSRELLEEDDGPWCFYTVGGMGLAPSIGLGIGIQSRTPVIVLDGDGSALMRLGAMSMIGLGAQAPLLHVLIDNGTHDSTGGQSIAGAHVDFPAIAQACGYQSSHTAQTLTELSELLETCQGINGAHMIHIRVKPAESRDLRRPGRPIEEIAQRFRDWCPRW